METTLQDTSEALIASTAEVAVSNAIVAIDALPTDPTHDQIEDTFRETLHAYMLIGLRVGEAKQEQRDPFKLSTQRFLTTLEALKTIDSLASNYHRRLSYCVSFCEKREQGLSAVSEFMARSDHP